ncbi:unnamed protein product [Rotaria socialis]|nr:unnamed protein product [Rotaria socialis]
MIYFNKIYQLCNPAKHLWWFCPWPNTQTTVCSWNDHFSIMTERIRSPESYEEIFSSLPKVRSSFEFNNLTLKKCTEPSIDI